MNRALFGKYWPGESPLHRMDSRAKLTFVVLVMVAIFCASSYAALGLCAAFLLACILIARIPLPQALRSIGPLFFIVIITALLNVFFVQGGTVYVTAGTLQISQAGIHNAVFLGIRLTLLLIDASLLTLTTTTLDLTDGIEAVLAPLRRIGFPAHEFSMIMGIALRFVPQFVTELHTIRAAQLSRGAKLATSPLRGGISSLTSLMIPLFTSAFRHAETLSAAMDARCYHGAEGRTKLKPLTFTSVDARGAIAVACLILAVIALRVAGL